MGVSGGWGLHSFNPPKSRFALEQQLKELERRVYRLEALQGKADGQLCHECGRAKVKRRFKFGRAPKFCQDCLDAKQRRYSLKSYHRNKSKPARLECDAGSKEADNGRAYASSGSSDRV